MVIGSNGPNEKQLKYAEDDAAGIAAVLSSFGCAFEVKTSIGEDSQSARTKLLTLSESCEDHDTFLAYFAGHGSIDRGDLFLLFRDSNTEKLTSTALWGHDILGAMRRCRTKNKVLILDCCNAGQLVARTGIRSGTGERVPMRELGFETDAFEVILASDALEPAREFESIRAGFVSSAIRDALTKDRVTADRDHDGAVSVADVHGWLEGRARYHNQQQTDPLERVPIPRRLGFGFGSTYLTRPPGVWRSVAVDMPDGIPGIVLPIAPCEGKFAYVIGKWPVTNRAYGEVNRGWAGPKARRHVNAKWSETYFDVLDDPEFGGPEQPVVGISLNDAKNYCMRLQQMDMGRFPVVAPPSPSLWERAAFGLKSPRSFPWFELQPEVHHRTNVTAACVDVHRRSNEFGVIDLIGNVWEWCVDETWWRWFGYIAAEKIPERVFADGSPVSGTVRVAEPSTRVWLKGGGFYDDLQEVEELTVEGFEIAGGREARNADIGLRISALIHLEELAKDVQEAIVGMPPLEQVRKRAIPVAR